MCVFWTRGLCVPKAIACVFWTRGLCCSIVAVWSESSRGRGGIDSTEEEEEEVICLLNCYKI